MNASSIESQLCVRCGMGMAARRLVEERFSEERVIAAYLQTLSEIVGSRG